MFYALFLTAASACIHIVLVEATNHHYIGFIKFVANVTGYSGSTDKLFTEASGVAVLIGTIALGPLFGYILNIPHVLDRIPWFGRWSNWILYRAIMNNDFELLLLRSVQNDRPVMFSMDDCKVYIGWIIRAPHPTEARKSVRLLPLASGFRDTDTRVVELTTDYLSAIEKIADDSSAGLNHLTYDDLEVVIPVDRIVSSHPFDFDAYMHFQSPEIILDPNYISDD